jgi:hypothetical protein
MHKLEVESSTLRTRLVQAEEERNDTLRVYRQQINELQAENSGLKSDADHREALIQRLEYELAMAAKNVHSAQQNAVEKEQFQNQFTRNLNGKQI